MADTPPSNNSASPIPSDASKPALTPTSSTTPASATPAKDAISKTTARNNAVLRALGMPNFRFRLPSRNWMIFLSIVGSWTATYYYDRRQKKKNQAKWAALVSHIASEPIHTNTMPRRMTVYLAAPPGDGVRSAREHFTEYVKPVLVAAAMDWDVVEGRREGEVRAGTAERIRRARRRAGESARTELEVDVPLALERLRDRIGVQEHAEVQGDIVIGRHTWKEYVRGIHEGWLGPLDAPAERPAVNPFVDPTAAVANALESTSIESGASTQGDRAPDQTSTQDAQSAEAKPSDPTPESKKEEKKPTKPKVTPPYNTPDSYADTPLPRSMPAELAPSTPVHFPHILGFLNTPTRCYRFLTRRYLADDIGRQTAGAVLAAHRGFQQEALGDARVWEQEGVLAFEEKDWHKSAKKREEGERERAWLDPMVVDPRIGERMMRFELSAANENRAVEIGKGTAGIPGRTAADTDVD